jgi:hypothetical protein
LIKARISEFHLPLCAVSKAKILHLEVVWLWISWS